MHVPGPLPAVDLQKGLVFVLLWFCPFLVLAWKHSDPLRSNCEQVFQNSLFPPGSSVLLEAGLWATGARLSKLVFLYGNSLPL